MSKMESSSESEEEDFSVLLDEDTGIAPSQVSIETDDVRERKKKDNCDIFISFENSSVNWMIYLQMEMW